MPGKSDALLAEAKLPGNSFNSFGILLRRHRVAAGYSQEALAERARLSAAAIGTIERGSRRAPRRETITSLADALALSDSERIDFFHASDRARARSTESKPRPNFARNRVPTFLSSFVGRERELSEVAKSLAMHGLVTITGSGGVGKTRLACELLDRVERHDDRQIAYVELAPVSDGAFVAATIAGVLGMALDQDDPERSFLSLISDKALVLVLDNCEHLLHETARLAEAILQSSTATSILATSRERLGIAGECVHRLPSLEVSEGIVTSIVEARRYSALDLFIQRTRSLDYTYTFTPELLALSAGICRRLDGIPLAIELAAARVPVMGISNVNARLFATYVLSSDDVTLPLRQRTMSAAIAWSYGLLEEAERTLARRLGIFAGTFTARAAAAVCSDDILTPSVIASSLTHLIEVAFVRINGDDEEPRYVVPESIRAFSSERSAEFGEVDRLARRHAEWLADYGVEMDDLFHSNERAKTLPARLDLDNIRAALEWSFASPAEGDHVLGATIVGSFRFLWQFLSLEAELLEWLNQALDRVDDRRHPLVAGKLYVALVQNVSSRDVEDANARATALFIRTNRWETLVQQNAYVILNFMAKGRVDLAEAAADRAWELLDRAHLRETRAHVNLLTNEAYVHVRLGRFDRARQNLAESRALSEAHVYTENESFYQYRRAVVEAEAGNIAGAIDIARAAIAFLEAQPMTADVIFLIHGIRSLLAVTLLLLENVSEAETQTRIHFESAGQFHGDTYYMGWLLMTLAATTALKKRPRAAARLHGWIDAWFRNSTNRRDPLAIQAETLLMASLREQLSEADRVSLAAAGAAAPSVKTIREALAD